MDWRVLSGPVVVKPANPVTSTYGRSDATVAPAGVEGIAIVRASAANLHADFSLTLSPALYLVRWRPTTATASERHQRHLASRRYDPRREDDDLAASPFDYDDHSVEAAGTPRPPGGGEFPYANPSEVRITFTQPGTYRYRDRYYGGTGTVVVR